jgi:hypothetical protein
LAPTSWWRAIARLAQPGLPPNGNPVITGVSVVDCRIDTLDERCRASRRRQLTLLPRSAATATNRTSRRWGPSGQAGRGPSPSWFRAAAHHPSANASDPTIDLRFDLHLPAPGAAIDLYVVARDERGGTDTAHRTFQLQ